MIPLTNAQRRATDLVTAGAVELAPVAFDTELLIRAPAGRADAFGVGTVPEAAVANPGGR